MVVFHDDVDAQISAAPAAADVASAASAATANVVSADEISAGSRRFRLNFARTPFFHLRS